MPINYEFPDLEYEIIESLYMADAQEGELLGRSQAEWDELETRALKITDNLGDSGLEEGVELRSRGSKYKPAGSIRVDEVIAGITTRTLPVVSIKVRARRGVKYGTGHTSGSGQFNINKNFRYDVRYSVEFETYDYKITNSIGFSVNYAGSKKRSRWNHTFTFAGTEDWAHATLVNASRQFDVKAGTARIKTPSLLNRDIKIRPIFEPGRSNAVGVVRRHFGAIGSIVKFNDVRLYMQNRRGTQFGTDNLYALMNHELAHVSHYLHNPTHYIGFGAAMLGESWAAAIEFTFTNSTYPRAVRGIADISEPDIVNGGNGNWKYTPFFIDLVDATDQRAVNGGSSDWASDKVSGYTFEQLQDAMGGSTSFSQFSDRLTRYGNPTGNFRGELFDFYRGIRNENR